jgi:ADP-ribose pyrophosphatase YjhB (NUDIX family)
VTSFGIALAWLPPGASEPSFLVVQRRDSYAYVEFLRGKYDIRNRRYVVEMFASMTEVERTALLTHGFQQLWDNLWGGCSLPAARPYGSPGGSPGGSPEVSPGGSPEGSPGGSPEGSPGGSPGGSPEGSPGGSPEGSPEGSPGGSPGGSPDATAEDGEPLSEGTKYGNRMEFFEARSKFRRLQKGVRMRTCDGEHIVLDLAYAADRGRALGCDVVVPEWGFPKGRRNRCGETGLECALRELQEETGIHRSRIEIAPGKPFEEVFTGSNGVRYRHVYYAAKVAGEPDGQGQRAGSIGFAGPAAKPAGKPRTRFCQRELRAAEFFDKDAVHVLFEGSKERQEVFKRLVRAACGAEAGDCAVACAGPSGG